MITDNLFHIETYRNLSSDIYVGLLFLKNATPDIHLGTYRISENVKAIVCEYPTVKYSEQGYEAHKHVIDIQYPIINLERVKWSPIDNMEVKTPYEEENDRIFYKNPAAMGCDVIIGNGHFAIMFPTDGHSPQHLVDKPVIIKKITIKVSINEEFR